MSKQKTVKTNQKSTRYLVFGLIIVFFVTPIFLAWCFYRSGGIYIEDTINHGNLISPPFDLNTFTLKNPEGEALDQKPLRGKWLIVYLAPKTCDLNCLHNLYLMRQIRTALGINASRVKRLLLTRPEELTQQLTNKIKQNYPGTLHVVMSQHKIMLIQSKASNLQDGGFFIVDPLGNIMMDYPSSLNPTGILSDLKRLLRVSNIG